MHSACSTITELSDFGSFHRTIGSVRTAKYTVMGEKMPITRKIHLQIHKIYALFTLRKQCFNNLAAV